MDKVKSKIVDFKGALAHTCTRCGKPPAFIVQDLMCDECFDRAKSLKKMDYDFKKILGGC